MPNLIVVAKATDQATACEDVFGYGPCDAGLPAPFVTVVATRGWFGPVVAGALFAGPGCQVH